MRKNKINKKRKRTKCIDTPKTNKYRETKALRVIGEEFLLGMFFNPGSFLRGCLF
jgi:hypothetical protein